MGTEPPRGAASTLPRWRHLVTRELPWRRREKSGPRCFARSGQSNWPAYAGTLLCLLGSLMLWRTPPWVTATDIFAVPLVLVVANLFGRVAARRAAQGASLKVVAHLVEFFSFGGAACVGAYGLVFWFQAQLPPS
ncbi:hypothetical protein BH20ACT9_BH20ACT9_05320 [soil metagenome]